MLRRRIALGCLTIACILAASILSQPVPRPVYAESAGVIFVVDSTCCGGFGGVLRVDPSQPSGSNQTVVSSGQNFTSSQSDIALAADGRLYAIDLGGGRSVIRVDPSQPNGSNQTVISFGQNFVQPRGVALAADGRLYVVDSDCCFTGTGVPNRGGVIRVDPSQPSGSNQTVISHSNGPGLGQNLVDARGIALAADGRLYVVDLACCGGGGGVIRVDPDPSLPVDDNQTVISFGQNFVDPAGIALAADGRLYVVDLACCGGGGGVIRVDPSQPSGSNQTIISSGQNFPGARSIALAADGRLYVVDANSGVIRIDPSQPSGSNQTVVSSGQNFASPRGLAVVPGVSIADAAVVEGATASFTVTLDPWSVLSIVVPYVTSNGTASAGSDYVAASGVVTFNPGQTSTTAIVPGLGDILDESAEAFTVTLQPPNGVGAADGTATGTIADDDATATLAIFDASVVEGDSGTATVVFPVTMSPPAGQAVTVDYATGIGSAQVGTDFQAVSGTLTFQAGETSKSVSVTINGDATYEPSETFSVTLSNPTGGATIGRAQASGTISNDDPLLACTPRPRVVQTPVAGAGQLAVRVESTPLNTQQNNLLQQLRFGSLDNAIVTLNGQRVAAGQTVTLSQNTVGVDFTIRRVTAGQPTTVHLTIVDGCGAWPTFVGGGTSAGF